MDLIALGANAGSVDVDLQQRNLINDINVAETVAIHRIISWQGLLLLKSDQLTSLSSSGDSNGGIFLRGGH